MYSICSIQYTQPNSDIIFQFDLYSIFGCSPLGHPNASSFGTPGVHAHGQMQTCASAAAYGAALFWAAGLPMARRRRSKLCIALSLFMSELGCVLYNIPTFCIGIKC